MVATAKLIDVAISPPGEETALSAQVRSARLYRSSMARFAEFIDGFIMLLVMAIVLRIYSADRLLAATLALALPMLIAGLFFWWALREANIYHFGQTPSAGKHAIRVIGVVAIGLPAASFLGASIAYFAGRPIIEGAREAAILIALVGAVLTIIHAFYAKIVNAMGKEGLFALNVVVVGATDTARRLIEKAGTNTDLNILGIYDDRIGRVPDQMGNVKLLGDLRSLMAWPDLPAVDRVIITIPPGAQSRVRQLIEKLRAMPNKVVLALDMKGFDADGTTIGRIGDMPVAYVSGTPADARRAFWKRVQDCTIASLALIILSPIMLVIAIAIKLDSPGPVFFKQIRHGFNNQPFWCWKFRSMRNDCADAKASQQVVAGDARVTKIGRFIRKTSLDELPQLFNVITSDMSLVGPRPHAIGMKTGDVESARLVADYAHRHRIKPGMTGWAAIHGSRGPVHTAEDVERRVELDVEYINNANFWLDLWIIMVTIPALLGDKSAIR